MSNTTGFLSHRKNQHLVISTVITLLMGTCVYHFIEGWRWLDAIYFSVMTLTTVGYGDFSPATDFGKIFTIFYALTGIGLMFSFINELFLHRVNTPRPSSFSKLRRKSQTN
tara:strand:- start:59 stop:391 length:333 start_codon:yes stop_codon:yes gene_type:complete